MQLHPKNNSLLSDHRMSPAPIGVKFVIRLDEIHFGKYLQVCTILCGAVTLNARGDTVIEFCRKIA